MIGDICNSFVWINVNIATLFVESTDWPFVHVRIDGLINVWQFLNRSLDLPRGPTSDDRDVERE